MKLSAKVRYGVRMMLSLARHYGNGSVYLREIAKAEEISEKYLSLIVIPLKGIGLVKSIRGAHGGYALAKSPAEITLKDIVDVLEGERLVDCIHDTTSCPRIPTCVSRDVWALLEGRISEVLNSFTLEQLVRLTDEKARSVLGENI